MFVDRTNPDALSPFWSAIVVPVPVTVAVPSVVMIEIAAIAIPAAFIVLISLITRFHPACAAVGRPSPVSLMPFVLVAYWIPVAVYPEVV